MAENNLLLILKSLDKKEMKEFRLFVYSPFFNSNQNVSRLFDEITGSRNNFSVGKIDNREIHKKIYGKKPCKEENIKTLIHLLTKLAEKYLAYKEFTGNPGDEKNKLLKAYDIRNIDKLFKKLEISEREKLAEINSINLNILYRKKWFEKAVIDYYSSRGIEKELHQAEIRLSEITIAVYFIEMFRQYNMFWRLDYVDYEIDKELVIPVLNITDIEKIDEILKNNNYKYYPLFEAYYCLYRSIDENEQTAALYMERFMAILEDKDSVIEKSEQFVLSTILVNFIHYLYRKDFIKYERKLFEAFKLLLKLYKYSGEKYLRLTIYTNLLRFGVQLKEFSWSREFIKKYSPMLEEIHRENMVNYGMCFVSFAEGNFEVALKYESKIDYKTMQMRYYMRDVRLCSLYELGEHESALNLVDSYRHFIKNEKYFKGELKIQYKSFIEFTNELIRFKNGSKRVNPEELLNRINSTNTIRKKWLIEKTKELI